MTVTTRAGQTYKLVGANGKDKVFASLDSKDNEVLIYSKNEVDELMADGTFTFAETAPDSYLVRLQKELEEARENFDKVKLKIIADVQNMTVYLASDFGGAYATKIDELTLAAAKARFLTEQIRSYKYHIS